MSEKMILKNVRGSYVYADKERKDGGYGIQVIMGKNDPQYKASMKLIQAAARAKFGDKVKMGMLKLPWRDADAEERDGAEYKGNVFLNANNTKKPGIVNRKNEPADEDDIEALCFSGAIFHVSVSFYGFDTDGNKGVAVSFDNLMLRKEGDRLDGSTTAGEDFDGLGDDGDDFDEKDEDW